MKHGCLAFSQALKRGLLLLLTLKPLVPSLLEIDLELPMLGAQGG